MADLADKTLTCRDCGGKFTFTVREQEFYASRGWENTPSRCPECRAARRRSGNGGQQPRRMYPVICAACGVETEVPFEPRSGRPVYCGDCFTKLRSFR
jgi:CxxC-x17-CxxC domain-containing protein